MAYEIVINKRFTNKLLNVLDYLEKEWGKKVAVDFQDKVFVRIYMLQLNPFIGAPVGITSVRSILINKQNRMYYRVQDNKVVILNLYDTRSNYKK
jgi:plasmid stabilization system protein ParE